ncbi:abortive infection family protein [Azonexus sp.]|uniref:abortive infection family protein n=1 Tax=Azonexus sp. TaxID=1872668 RepID=UPI0035B21480
MKISEATRRDLIDSLLLEKVHWSGRLEEPDFLARIFDVNSMPSRDNRFSSAYRDIWQHRVNNPDDWGDDWVFYDPRFDLLHADDELFLNFLCETLHPVVRSDPEEVECLRQLYNHFLRGDGYELLEKARMAGRPVFAARQAKGIDLSSLKTLKEAFSDGSPTYIARQITRMESNIDSDPDLAIGTAKELIETVCRTILAQRSIEAPVTLELAQLVKLTSKELKLTPSDIGDEEAASDSIRRLLGNLGTITQSLAELRNRFGTGHGKAADSRGLQPRHAKLAVGAASTLALFLHETSQEQR